MKFTNFLIISQLIATSIAFSQPQKPQIPKALIGAYVLDSERTPKSTLAELVPMLNGIFVTRDSICEVDRTGIKTLGIDKIGRKTIKQSSYVSLEHNDRIYYLFREKDRLTLINEELSDHQLFFREVSGDASHSISKRYAKYLNGLTRSRLATAIFRGEIEVSIKHVRGDTKNQLQWSPKGALTKLESAADGSKTGKIIVGEFDGIACKFERSNVDQLIAWIDHDDNGKFTINEKIECSSAVSRGKTWYQFETTFNLRKKNKLMNKYPVRAWLVAEMNEKSIPAALRWTRNCWMQGEFEIWGKQIHVVVADSNNNGNPFEKSVDSWAMGDMDNYRKYSQAASMNQHVWVDGVAFVLLRIGNDGTSVFVKAVDLGVSEQEDRDSRDVLAKDRKYPRARNPIKFESDLDTVVQRSKDENKLIFLDFTATWCGPCHSMDKLVFTAEPIANQADRFIFVKVDGDERKDLKKKFKIEAFPTILIIDSDRRILKRRKGYTSVAEMLKFMNSIE